MEEQAQGVYSVLTLLTGVSVELTWWPVVTSRGRPKPSKTVLVQRRLGAMPVVTLCQLAPGAEPRP